jgi:MFS family permease
MDDTRLLGDEKPRRAAKDPDRPAVFIFRPRVVTVMFTVVSLVNYFDRGLFASVLKPISSAAVFDLSKTMAGLINSMFIVGFMVFSPIFAHLAHRFEPLHLTAFGLALWSASSVVAALSHNFWIFLAARTVCGAGEASFVSLVPPFIEDYAPPAQRTKWLSLFYLSVPVGAALGYIVGGPSAKRSVDGWRWPFLGQGAVMLPLALYVALVPLFIRGRKLGKEHRDRDEVDEKRRERRAGDYDSLATSGGGEGGGGGGEGRSVVRGGGADPTSVSVPVVEHHRHRGDNHEQQQQQQHLRHDHGRDPIDKDHGDHGAAASASSAEPQLDLAIGPSLWRLARNPVYVLSVLGYSCYQFVVGGISTWGVTYLEDPPHNVDADSASTIFGGCAAGGGLIGTVLGGLVVDYFGGSTGSRGMQRALKVCTLFTAASIPFFEAAFIVHDVRFLYALIFLGQCLLWTSSAPLNSAVMTSVDPLDRGLALAVSVFFMHALGDFPSSVGIGAVQDKLNNWTLTMMLVIAYLGFCVMFWGLAWLGAYRRTRRVAGLASAPRGPLTAEGL